MGAIYRVQPGQRVMFQHGSLHEVVDQEKEPCGCPAPPKAEVNEFPLAQSEGLTPAPPSPPETAIKRPTGNDQAVTTLVHNEGDHSPQPVSIPSPPAEPVVTYGGKFADASGEATEEAGVFPKIGRFFKPGVRGGVKGQGKGQQGIGSSRPSVTHSRCGASTLARITANAFTIRVCAMAHGLPIRRCLLR